MKIHPSATADRVMEAVRRYHESLDTPGFCVHCGAEAQGVEPDAERYFCETCDEDGVYGASELLFYLVI